MRSRFLEFNRAVNYADDKIIILQLECLGFGSLGPGPLVTESNYKRPFTYFEFLPVCNYCSIVESASSTCRLTDARPPFLPQTISQHGLINKRNTGRHFSPTIDTTQDALLLSALWRRMHAHDPRGWRAIKDAILDSQELKKKVSLGHVQIFKWDGRLRGKIGVVVSWRVQWYIYSFVVLQWGVMIINNEMH